MADGQVVVQFKTDGAEKLQSDVSRVIISLNQLEAMSKYKTLTFANISQELMKAAQSAEQMENSIREASKIKLGINVPATPVPVSPRGGAVVPYVPAVPVPAPQRTPKSPAAPTTGTGLLGARQGRLAGLSELEKLSPALSKLATNLNNVQMKINGLVMLFARLTLYAGVFKGAAELTSSALEKIFDLKFATNVSKWEQGWNVITGQIYENLEAWQSMNGRILEAYKEESDRLKELRSLDKDIARVSEKIADRQTQRSLEKLRQSGSSEQIQSEIDALQDKIDALQGDRLKLEKQRVNLARERSELMRAKPQAVSFENRANAKPEELKAYEQAQTQWESQLLGLRDKEARLNTAFADLEKTTEKLTKQEGELLVAQDAARSRERDEAQKARMAIFDQFTKAVESYQDIFEKPKSLDQLNRDFDKLDESVGAALSTFEEMKSYATGEQLTEALTKITQDVSTLASLKSQIDGFKKELGGFTLGGRGEAADALARVGGYVGGGGGNYYNTQSRIERNTRETANAVKLISKRRSVATFN